MKIGIVSIQLQYKFPDSMTNQEIEQELMDVNLPKEYVEDSFEFVKIEKE